MQLLHCRNASALSAAKLNAHYGEGSGPIWLGEVNCTGDEDDIERCEHSDWGEVTGCLHSQHVGVECSKWFHILLYD